MAVRKINHIGIAVRSIEQRLELWQELLGLELVKVEDIPEQKVKVAMVKIGESTLELLEPSCEDSPLHKFLETKGEGIHHLAVSVDDIEAAISDVKESGGRMIDEQPRQGASAQLIAFVHPKSAGGVLLEFCQGEH